MRTNSIKCLEKPAAKEWFGKQSRRWPQLWTICISIKCN